MNDDRGLRLILEFLTFGGSRDLQLLSILFGSAYLFAAGWLADTLIANYVLTLRVRGELDRGQGACRRLVLFHALMAVSCAVSWLVFEIIGPPYDDTFWILGVTTVAFAVAALATTWRLGRWPGLSNRAERRLDLPAWTPPWRGGRAHRRRHLERYERLRAHRLGLPPPFDPDRLDGGGKRR